MNTRGETKKRTSWKNMDGRSTSSHDSKKFRTRSMEKQGGMAFAFRKTATAVIKPDRWIDCAVRQTYYAPLGLYVCGLTIR
jgi:hypothetical protein